MRSIIKNFRFAALVGTAVALMFLVSPSMVASQVAGTSVQTTDVPLQLNIASSFSMSVPTSTLVFDPSTFITPTINVGLTWNVPSYQVVGLVVAIKTNALPSNPTISANVGGSGHTCNSSAVAIGGVSYSASGTGMCGATAISGQSVSASWTHAVTASDFNSSATVPVSFSIPAPSGSAVAGTYSATAEFVSAIY